MEITFCTHDLEKKFNEIKEFCDEYGILISYDNKEKFYNEFIKISKETELVVLLPGESAIFSLTERTNFLEFHNLINDAKNGKIVNDSKFISSNRVLVYTDCHEKYELDFIPVDELKITDIWNSKKITVSLRNGLNCYSLRLTMDRLYDKYFPPLLESDLFIEITSSETIEEESIDAIVQAFIFELGTSLGLNLYTPNRQNFIGEDIEEDEFNDDPIRLRPLLQGKGLSDVINIYNSANEIRDPEFLILMYTKVIEYVSQTVLRKEMVDSITKKLHSPTSLKPDANFILELEKLYDEHKLRTKDSQAIKLTIETCCDIMDLVSFAPPFLKKIKKFDLSSSKEERSKCLEELASAISDTRNRIAHAKTNYRLKGYECPEDQLGDFATCLKTVASQIIRWFARQSEESRII
ncbi:hypothetical protein [Paenibacillus agilis]|uniref:Uncharacterized protein n=1 Tax=Paenibacillus agilis TaxID=3020863 RepID=A0A559IZK9_9BACL|nr:hypothetical protein [Paenibacillus agilis]TVX93061.1 hypothetical protein FPZ44_08300 [Paenibacillus agilis]